MKYPEPFNSNPVVLEDGDRVVDKDGSFGTIKTSENIKNRPGDKWELVEYDNEFYDQHGNKHKRAWKGNIWIKKI